MPKKFHYYVLAAILVTFIVYIYYIEPVNTPKIEIETVKTIPIADEKPNVAPVKQLEKAISKTPESKEYEIKGLPKPEDFFIMDGKELVLKLDDMNRLNDVSRIDTFAKQLRAETRSEDSLAEERRLTEFLQSKIQTFRRSGLSRIDCGEYFCLFVAPVSRKNELFDEYMSSGERNNFGSGGYYNFESNGEKYNSIVISLKEDTSLAIPDRALKQ